MKTRNRKRWLRAALAVAAMGASVMVSAGCYSSWARTQLENEMARATRDEDGYPLGGGPVRIDRGRRRACLLLHGYPSTPADFGDLPAALDEAGWDVWAPVLNGFGTDPRDLEKVKAEDLVENADAEFTALRERYDEVVVCGYSMGGALATILAEREDLDTVVLVCPLYAVRHRWYYGLSPRAWHGIGRYLVDYVAQPDDMVHVNRPEGRDKLIAYRVTSVKSTGELFRLTDMARAATPQTNRLLMLLSPTDGVISTSSARSQFRNWQSTEKTLTEYERSDHGLFVDYDAEDAARAVVEFLSEGDDPQADSTPPDAAASSRSSQRGT